MAVLMDDDHDHQDDGYSICLIVVCVWVLFYDIMMMMICETKNEKKIPLIDYLQYHIMLLLLKYSLMENKKYWILY